MKRLTSALSVWALLGVVVTSAIAEEDLYTFSGRRLQTINLAGETEDIGPSGYFVPPGLDFSPCDGKLYGATFGWIWEFDTSTGAPTLFKKLIGPVQTATAFAFAPDGRLFVSNNAVDAVYEVDLDTGEERLVGHLGLNMWTSGWDFSADGTLYLVEGGTNALYTVDLDDGHATKIGNGIGINFNATDIAITTDGAFVSGSAILFPGIGYHNSVFEVDLVTGAKVGIPIPAETFQPAALAGRTPANVSCTLAKRVLWSPNHKMIDVGVGAVDGCGNAAVVVGVTILSDEDDDEATGAGNHSPDAVFDDEEGTLQLRAERKGNSDGRVYVVIVKALTAAGTIGFAECTVVVPHSKKAAALEAVIIEAATVDLGDLYEVGED